MAVTEIRLRRELSDIEKNLKSGGGAFPVLQSAIKEVQPTAATPKNIDKAVSRLQTILRDNPKLMEMGAEERLKELQKMASTGPLIPGTDLSPQAVNALIQGVVVANPEYATSMSALVNIHNTRQADAIAKARETAIREATADLPGTWKELFFQQLGAKGGFNTDNMLKVWRQQTKAMLGATDKNRLVAIETMSMARIQESTQKAMQDMRTAMGDENYEKWLKTDEGKVWATELLDRESKKASTDLQYALLSPQGQANEVYQSAVDRVETVLKAAKGSPLTEEQRKIIAIEGNVAKAAQSLKPGMLDVLMQTDNLRMREVAGLNGQEIRNKLRDVGGDINKLSEEDKASLVSQGYSVAAGKEQDNLRLANARMLGEAYRLGGKEEAQRVIVQAASTTALRSLEIGETEREKAANLLSGFWSSAEYKKDGLSNKAFDTYIENIRKNGQTEQQGLDAVISAATSAFNEGASTVGVTKDTTDVFNILSQIFDVVKDLVPNVPDGANGKSNTEKDK